jgi:NAD-dependent dihydropyrimidine dehydrogenase PreA subunit
MDEKSQFIADLLYLLSETGLSDIPKLLIYLVPFIVTWAIYKKIKAKRDEESTKSLLYSQAAGYSEPMSLHPVIDRNICLGCATCVDACPDGNVLGVIKEKAQLVTPSVLKPEESIFPLCSPRSKPMYPVFTLQVNLAAWG